VLKFRIFVAMATGVGLM